MHYFKILFAVLLILTTASCSKTTLTVKSNPPGARAVLKNTGLSVITDSKMELPKSVFGKKDHSEEAIVFSKEGYRTIEITRMLHKGDDNIVAADLDKFDTFLEIKSTPAPIHLRFSPTDKLPKDWPNEFTTPINLTCTHREAQQLSSSRLVMEVDKGYIPSGEYRQLITSGFPLNLSLKPGYKNEMNISLKPVVTTLQVMTSPDGAIVEDISSAGFGYIGVTPLVRNFNWEDVVLWSDRISTKANGETVGKKREALYGSSLYLDLRISKPGFQDAYLRRLRLPVGEERAFHKNLNTIISTLTFASDPTGVHVYVERSRTKEVYNQATGAFVNKSVTHKKHLGTTPFTLNMDPNDPLQHGEKLIFEKSGYTPGMMEFAEGDANYYQVMIPVNIKER
jgi:hypothetical protein